MTEMAKADQHIQVQGYSADSSAYYARARRCYDEVAKTGKAEPMIYAALELRNCIERLLFEYLVLLGHDRITKAQAKAYRPTEIKDYILAIEPDFDIKMRFTGLITQALTGSGVYVLNLVDVSQLYGRLGAYLHAPKRPDVTVENPRWWGRLNEALQETFGVLELVYTNAIASVKLHGDGIELYARWKRGEIDDREAAAVFLEGVQSPRHRML